jgi:hypothetical protein
MAFQESQGNIVYNIGWCLLGVLSPGKPGFIFDPSSPPEEFHRLARLCSNPSLVGNKLLEHAIAFARDTELSISC